MRNLLTFDILANQTQTIEEFVAKKNPFRQVFPGIGQRVPFRFAVCSQAAADAYRKFVEPHLRQILSSNNVSYQSISLRRLIPVGDETSHDIDTLVVETSCEDPSAMKQASRKIYERFQQSDLDMKKIEVEIVNPLRSRRPSSHPLTDETVVLQMRGMKETIMQQVRNICKGSWSSVAFHNRSLHSTDSHIPTVIVFCLPGSRADFSLLETRLQATLRASKTPIALEILSGFITDCPHETRGGDLSMFDMPSKPSNGASIGARGNKDEAGTLGGWMTLTLSDQKRIPLTITCYHVIRSYQNPSLALATDRDGIKMSDNDQIRALVEYPAAPDREYTARLLDDMPDRQARFLSMAANPIGQVLAASGYKVNKANRRMDWALIESPITYSKNIAPSRFGLRKLQQPPLGSYNIGEQFIITKTAAVQVNEFVIKKGRTSGITSGFINKMQRVIAWPSLGGRETEEIEVMGLGGDFADPGDSGSFITDIRGRLVGLLFAKDACASDYDVGFMTPIHDIQDNVREVTGATLSLA